VVPVGMLAGSGLAESARSSSPRLLGLGGLTDPGELLASDHRALLAHPRVPADGTCPDLPDGLRGRWLAIVLVRHGHHVPAPSREKPWAPSPGSRWWVLSVPIP
jgi:hypothetical protein